MLLHQYCNIFGQPNEGFHKTRFFGLAFYDLIGTLLIAILLHKYLSFFKNTTLLITFMYVFCFATIMHLIFGVNTAFLNFIHIYFPKCSKIKLSAKNLHI